jgi:hypothetical protein
MMRQHLLLLPAVMGLVFLSCSNTTDDNDGGANGKVKINPNIVKIKDCCVDRFFLGDLTMGYLRNQKIYSAWYGYLRITDSFAVVADSNVRPTISGGITSGHLTYMSDFARSSDAFLVVISSYRNVSVGWLCDYGIAANTIIPIKDTTYSISSALYWHGDDSRLIYYSYGNDTGLAPGYYLYNKTTNQDSLLFPHRSAMGPSEMLNGFDLSPDNRKLLIPNVRSSWQQNQTPQIIEYDLWTQQADTFATEFDFSLARLGLWLRYSPDGTRILYCNFPLGSFTETTNDNSEVGIIEIPSRTKRILDVNTQDCCGGQSVQVAPTWTPDGNNIIYGSGPVFFPSGAKGFFSLYVLRNINDPRNYK